MIVLLLFFKYFVMRKFKRFSLDNFPYFSCNIFSQIYLLSVTFMFSIFITRIISPAFYVEKKHLLVSYSGEKTDTLNF